ncbi:LysM peptidoglycan-binding domain-containing protein [Bacillus sp. SKDU12]|uniref:LysM peptidoglycan-binding domain-containing protein n=1 Tax=Bacillus sp. SKDU12 TaxID=1337053 RepID=UPI00138993DC|nr:stage VI sporulation protein D [Bacillus sp. SKDU12]
MPQNHRLQFSVEESIYFQKGQEVSELLSISLDPDIRVQEVNDYVSIRGSLELTGEYNIDQNKHTEEMYTDKRFVEEVRKRADGSAELAHCFPVDITIPKNKVSHLQDVFVFIDAFDYQLTDSRILTIQADLAIEGLLDDTADKEPEIPLYEASAAFREEELSEPPMQRATEGVLQNEITAESPELFISEAGLREELETEKAESANLNLESVFSERETREGVEDEACPAELAKRETESRQDSELEEDDALETEDQEIVKAENEPPESAAESADVREEADPAAKAEPQAETVSSEAPVSPILEYALRQEAQNEETEEPEHTEPAYRQQTEEQEHAEPALRQETEERERAEPALRQETEERERAEPAYRQETEKSEHAKPAFRQETENREHTEPAYRQETEKPTRIESEFRQKAEEALETESQAVSSIEESREGKSSSAPQAENDEAALQLHHNQKASLKEETSQEEESAPAYRTFLPEHEDEVSFYSAPKLLEEEEQGEESFQIEVRKIPPAEEPEEETSLQSFQQPNASETEREKPKAVPRTAPAAEKKEPQANESNNSLYLTKLFTREEDEFSRMKICIVQQEDTIERLCERYEITSQQLIRMNSLALDDELKAGQILYIPQNKHSHA